MDDDILIINETWPATTIDGEPGLVAGMLGLSRTPGGGFLLNLVVGPDGVGPEDCDHVEFVLSPDHVETLRDALAS